MIGNNRKEHNDLRKGRIGGFKVLVPLLRSHSTVLNPYNQ